MHAARKDADPHFQFTDESSPALQRPQSQRSNGSNLYDDPVADEQSYQRPSSKGTATNVDNSRRGNDFGAQYSMTDSPAQNENVAPSKRPTRSDMSQHWAFSSPKPEQKIYKTAGDGMGGRKSGAPAWMAPEQENQAYKTAGDGMGGRRTVGGGRSWGFGDESKHIDEKVFLNYRTLANPLPFLRRSRGD